MPITIEIVVDDAGVLGWRATTSDLSQVYWWMSVARHTVLRQATEPQSAIVAPGPLRVTKAS